MIRATVISALADFLSDPEVYEGAISILKETAAGEMQTPYAIVRIGSGEQLYPGTHEIWDLNILVAVFQDADVTTAENAEAAAAGLFEILDDPAPMILATEGPLVWSAFERTGTEASIVENRWQHVAVYRGIVAPG